MIRQVVCALVLLISVSAFFTLLGKMWIDTPIVVLDYQTKECVRVESPRTEDTCENLPDRFNYEWSNQ